jgi:hypothetical protein
MMRGIGHLLFFHSENRFALGAPHGLADDSQNR